MKLDEIRVPEMYDWGRLLHTPVTTMSRVLMPSR
jgi:hypothetical protein